MTSACANRLQIIDNIESRNIGFQTERNRATIMVFGACERAMGWIAECTTGVGCILEYGLAIACCWYVVGDIAAGWEKGLAITCA
jgi:hypothetical protein